MSDRYREESLLTTELRRERKIAKRERELLDEERKALLILGLIMVGSFAGVCILMIWIRSNG